MPHDTATAEVAIILVNWNGWRDSIACIQSCLALGGVRFRILLCDNDSGDGSVERIHAWARGAAEAPPVADSPVPIDPNLRPRGVAVIDRAAAERGEDADGAELLIVRTGGNLGFAGGNNVGLRWALAHGSTHAWLLNNDTVVPPEALAKLVAAVDAAPGAGLAGSLMLEYHQPDRLQGFCGAMDRRTLRGRHIGAGLSRDAAARTDHKALIRASEDLYPIGASMLATRAFLQTVGLMEEGYFLYYEEADWVARGLGRFGTIIACDSIVYHKVGQSAGTTSEGLSARSVGFMYRSRLAYGRRFAPRSMPRAVAVMLVDAAKALARGRTGRAVGAFNALTGRVRVPGQS